MEGCIITSLLTPAIIRSWLQDATAALNSAQEEINALNVYPVPDSDTGTNSYFTVRDASVAVEEAEPGLGLTAVLQVLAEGALLGARGNSGIIISTWLGGLARISPGQVSALPDTLPDDDLASRFALAAAAAAEAVLDLQEGMAPRVAQEFASEFAQLAAAESADNSSAQVGGHLARAVLKVRSELPALALSHPTLRTAGVIDSGSCTLLLLISALALQFLDDENQDLLRAEMASTAWISEHTAAVATAAVATAAVAADQAAQNTELADPDCAITPSAGMEYEVLALLRCADPKFGAVLRPRLGAVGNSVSIVANADLWQVHVHGPAPRELLDCFPGTALRQIRIHRLRTAGGAGDFEVVVVTSDWERVQQYADAGAHVLLAPRGRKIKHRHLVRALRDTAAGDAVVLFENGTPHSARVAGLISGQVGAGSGTSFWQDDAEQIMEILGRLSQAQPAAQE